MIRIEHLCKSYHNEEVLHIDALVIPAGQCFGLVGNNGAGKTTLFRSVLDLIRPESGIVLSSGIDVAKSEEWKAYTGSYLDENFLIPFLTAEEYFAFVAKAYSVTIAEMRLQLDLYKDFFNGEILGQRKYIRDFSLGNKRKIGIVAALMVQPKVLVLDEPFANLDPSSQLKLRKLLQDLQAAKTTTMLISSHDLVHITSVCERIALLEKGIIIKDLGRIEEMLKELALYFAS
jgi:ABC-2 type transport system ATP-binding protein